MTNATRTYLLLVTEWLSALRANDPEAFKRWLAGGLKELGDEVMEELMGECFPALMGPVEADRLVAWRLGVRL